MWICLKSLRFLVTVNPWQYFLAEWILLIKFPADSRFLTSNYFPRPFQGLFPVFREVWEPWLVQKLLGAKLYKIGVVFRSDNAKQSPNRRFGYSNFSAGDSFGKSGSADFRSADFWPANFRSAHFFCISERRFPQKNLDPRKNRGTTENWNHCML